MTLLSGYENFNTCNFLLDEKVLIRIHSLLEESISELDGDFKIVYHVSRQDNRFYETHCYNEILLDNNIANKKIDCIEVQIRNYKSPQAGWIFKIVFRGFRHSFSSFDFSNNGAISTQISHEDKKWALSLSDRLEPIIERMINNEKVPRLPLTFFLISFVAMIYFILAKLESKTNFISYIAEKVAPLDNFIFSISLVVAIIALANFIGSINFNKIIGPETVFLIGAEEQEYNKRVSFRKNIFWVVIVGGIVSLIISFLQAFLF